jgi:ABC-type dipeptide/oligopeptide/nickel transport system permease subunit
MNTPSTQTQVTEFTDTKLTDEITVKQRPGFLVRLARNRLAFIGFMFVTLIFVVAIVAPLIAPYGYGELNVPDAAQFPSWKHPFGTDLLGRDILSRTIYATRYSMLVAVSVQVISLSVGIPVGFLAGLKGGLFETVLNQVVMIFTSLPGFLFAMFLMTVLGGGIPQLIFAMSVTGWVGYARIMRAEVLRLKERDFVTVSRALGASETRISLKHLFPNSLTALIVSVALSIPQTIYTEAGLSYLGLGIRDPLPSWGKMINESIPFIRLYWHLLVVPLLTLSITTVSFVFVADAIRDLLDVKHVAKKRMDAVK